MSRRSAGDLLLSDVADGMANRCLDDNLHLTALWVGAPAAPGAALKITDEAYHFLYGKTASN